MEDYESSFMTSPTLSEKIHRTLTELDLLQIDTNEAHQAIMEAIRESVPMRMKGGDKLQTMGWNACVESFERRIQ